MNDVSKSIFTSLTFWGIFATAVNVIAKHFGYDVDAVGLSGDLVNLSGLALAAYGRFRATQQVHVIPPMPPLMPPDSKGFVRFRMLIVLVLASLAFACATTPRTPAQAVYAVQGAYASALSIAVSYKELPACGQPTSPVLCSRPEIVVRLQEADDVAYAALTAAQDIVRTPGAGLNVQTAIAAAEEAVGALVKITTGLGGH